MLPFAVRTGLEPATPGVTGRYSNQLNYRTICSDFYTFLSNADAKVRIFLKPANFSFIFFALFWHKKGGSPIEELPPLVFGIWKTMKFNAFVNAPLI